MRSFASGASSASNPSCSGTNRSALKLGVGTPEDDTEEIDNFLEIKRKQGLNRRIQKNKNREHSRRTEALFREVGNIGRGEDHRKQNSKENRLQREEQMYENYNGKDAVYKSEEIEKRKERM